MLSICLYCPDKNTTKQNEETFVFCTEDSCLLLGSTTMLAEQTSTLLLLCQKWNVTLLLRDLSFLLMF